MQNSDGSQPPWPLVKWMLGIESRISRLEMRGDTTTAHKDDPRTWLPRDYMMAGAGISMVMAALSEKIGWSTVIAGLVRLYGGK